MPTDFHARHADLLQQAVEHAAHRGYWTPYPETPSTSAYGAEAPQQGEAAFRALLGNPFPLEGHPGAGTVPATEFSPYGFPLDVSYPYLAPDTAVATAKAAAAQWRAASPDTRAGVAAEILARLNAASFEIAHAVQHTTGQPFVMAFQAGGPHAQDRGLEAVAYAWYEQKRHPATARWSKPQRRGGPLARQLHRPPPPSTGSLHHAYIVLTEGFPRVPAAADPGHQWSVGRPPRPDRMTPVP